jgi:hypothetical protein
MTQGSGGLFLLEGMEHQLFPTRKDLPPLKSEEDSRGNEKQKMSDRTILE